MLRKIMMGLLCPLIFPPVLFAEQVGPFRIFEVSVYSADNMMFRVGGMGQMSSCPGHPWAYVDESDSGSKTKVSTLLAAYTAKKNVYLNVSAVNFFNNGVFYCQVSSIAVQD